jgi:DNA-binding NarL/FixJ family response regulator
MRRRRVAVLSRDPLLKQYLKQRLADDPAVELVERLQDNPEAILIDCKFLTRAERDLLRAIVKYGSIKTAAAKLYRSERTLKRQLASIREKLGFRTTLQAVVWALQNGVISMDDGCP